MAETVSLPPYISASLWVWASEIRFERCFIFTEWGGLAYGGLPSYTLHLGKRFMEHKSGGVASTTIFVLQRDGRKVVFI